MNIPLDNLYHWVQSLAQHPVMLYVFRPHGSKDIFDLDVFDNRVHPYTKPLAPVIICHDQEPLNFFDSYAEYDPDHLRRLFEHRRMIKDHIDETLFFCPIFLQSTDSKFNYLRSIASFNDWIILLHSEKNSTDIEQFAKHGFVPVYYWSHAMIARDWYRFAQHDSRLKIKNPKKTFLVYCRDWMPNREYRLKFLDLVVQHALVDDCVISTQHVNNQGVHLQDYQAQDSRFTVDVGTILSSIPNCQAGSSSSADYDTDDITSTRVSIILETVVDGSKIHLTEKILRAIACAHPFLLAAGPGALEYLINYGFRTFDEFWDERYDLEQDTVSRLEKITTAMQQIQNLSANNWKKIQCIADHNQQRFFSKDFADQVTQELSQNLNQAVEFCLDNRGDRYWQWRKFIRRNGLIKQWANSTKSAYERETIKLLRQHRLHRFHNDSGPGIVK